jgi:hypothetical protein
MVKAQRLPVVDPGAFWARVDASGGPSACWQWQRARFRTGYGALREPKIGTTLLAHRVAWTLTRGAIPDGFHVLHRCDNRPCCNPAHLFLGTDADNVRDMDSKGRRRNGPRYGEANSSTKLTDAQVAAMRAEYAAGGATHRGLAEKYGVSRGNVAFILSGKTRRSLSVQPPLPEAQT